MRRATWGPDARDGHHPWGWCWGPRGLPHLCTPLYLNTHFGETGCLLPGRAQRTLATERPPRARGPGAPPPLGLASTHPPIHSASVLGLHLEGAIPQGAWELGRVWVPLGERLGGHRDPGSPEGSLLLQRESTRPLERGLGWLRTVCAPSLASASGEGENTGRRVLSPSR